MLRQYREAGIKVLSLTRLCLYATKLSVYDLRRMRDNLELNSEVIRNNEDMEKSEIQPTLEEMKEDDTMIKAALSTMLEQWHRTFHLI
jgi:hypothetical protein